MSPRRRAAKAASDCSSTAPTATCGCYRAVPAGNSRLYGPDSRALDSQHGDIGLDPLDVPSEVCRQPDGVEQRLPAGERGQSVPPRRLLARRYQTLSLVAVMIGFSITPVGLPTG